MRHTVETLDYSKINPISLAIIGRHIRYTPVRAPDYEMHGPGSSEKRYIRARGPKIRCGMRMHAPDYRAVYRNHVKPRRNEIFAVCGRRYHKHLLYQVAFSAQQASEFMRVELFGNPEYETQCIGFYFHFI